MYFVVCKQGFVSSVLLCLSSSEGRHWKFVGCWLQTWICRSLIICSYAYVLLRKCTSRSIGNRMIALYAYSMHCTLHMWWAQIEKDNHISWVQQILFLIQTNKFGNCYKYNLELLQIHFAIRRCISSGELEANTRPLQNRRLGLRNVFSGFACEILLQEYFPPLRQDC